MIEWTICTVCKSVVDNTNETCPNCGGEVVKHDISFVKDYFNSMLFLIKTVNSLKDFCPPIKDIDYESVLYDDLFNWFGYLGLGDNVITDNELEFINELLEASYTKADIMALSDIEMGSKLLPSFEYAGKIDEFTDGFGIAESLSANLFECFRMCGGLFVFVDGTEVDDTTLKRFNDFISNLKSRLNIDSTNLMTKTASQVLGKIETQTQEIPETEEKHSLDEYLEELNKLIGLKKVKKDVNSLINLVQIRKLRDERGIKQPPMSLHLVF